MNADNPALLALVRAVCDGAHVDWDSAGTDASDSFKSVLAELRVVADVANLNRSLSGETGREPVAPAALLARAPGPSLARWGHLHLLEHVASGSFGDVYRAWDPAIDREVALKLLRPQSHSESGVDETIEEGRLLARVRHPNVVTVYGAARIDGRVGIWMEFIQGRTLAAVIQQDGPLPAQDVIARGVTLCEAMAAVHDAGLLHRDIKAQNVMLTPDGRVVLMDFGAGRPVDERSRDVAGTPLYLAPEVAQGQDATPRSDVYSLGVLLHFLARGAFPAVGFALGQGTEPRPVTGTRASGAVPIARDLERVIARAIAWDPDARFDGARDLGVALTQLSAPIPARRRRIAFFLTAAGLTTVAAAATIPLARGRLTGAPASPAVPVSSEEALRKLPWRVGPTGPPSRDGRFMGAVDWNTPSGGGLPVLIDLGTGAVNKLMEPRQDEAEAGAFSDSSSIALDTTRIAFSWAVPGPDPRTELRMCALDGSALRTVYRDPQSEFRVIGWSGTGDEVLLLRYLATGQSELVWIAVQDGRSRLVSHLPFVPFASLHPNGRDLLMDWPQPNAPDKRDLMIADMLTGRIRPLLTAPANDTMPVWLPDGQHVLFASDRGGTFGVWLTDTEGSEPQQVRGSMGYWQPVGFGTHNELYYLAQTGTVDVYTARVDLDARTVGPRESVAISFQGRNLFSDWAPDSRHLAFTSRRGSFAFSRGNQYLIVRDLASNDERVLPVPIGMIGLPRWAPDGRRIAFPGGDDVRVLDTRSGRTDVSCRVPGGPRNLEWASNDRVWLVTDDASGSSLRTVTFPSCETRQLARDVPFFSMSRARDQVAINSRAPDGITVAVARIDALGERREVLRSPSTGQLQLAGWTPDDGFILAIGSISIAGQPRPARWELVAIPSRGGASPISVSLAALGDPPLHARLSPDGSQISYEAGAPVVTPWVLQHPLFAR